MYRPPLNIGQKPSNQETFCATLTRKLFCKSQKRSAEEKDIRDASSERTTTKNEIEESKGARKNTKGPEYELKSLIRKLKRTTPILQKALESPHAYEKAKKGCETCSLEKDVYKTMLKTMMVIELITNNVIETEQRQLLEPNNESNKEKEVNQDKELPKVKEETRLSIKVEVFCQKTVDHNLKCVLLKLQKAIGELLVQISFVKARKLGDEERYRKFNISLSEIEQFRYEYSNLTNKIIQLFNDPPRNQSKKLDLCISCVKEELTGYTERFEDILLSGKNLKVVMRNENIKPGQCCSRNYPHIHAIVQNRPIVLKFSMPFIDDSSLRTTPSETTDKSKESKKSPKVPAEGTPYDEWPDSLKGKDTKESESVSKQTDKENISQKDPMGKENTENKSSTGKDKKALDSTSSKQTNKEQISQKDAESKSSEKDKKELNSTSSKQTNKEKISQKDAESKSSGKDKKELDSTSSKQMDKDKIPQKDVMGNEDSESKSSSESDKKQLSKQTLSSKESSDSSSVETEPSKHTVKGQPAKNTESSNKSLDKRQPKDSKASDEKPAESKNPASTPAMKGSSNSGYPSSVAPEKSKVSKDSLTFEDFTLYCGCNFNEVYKLFENELPKKQDEKVKTNQKPQIAKEASIVSSIYSSSSGSMGNNSESYRKHNKTVSFFDKTNKAVYAMEIKPPASQFQKALTNYEQEPTSNQAELPVREDLTDAKGRRSLNGAVDSTVLAKQKYSISRKSKNTEDKTRDFLVAESLKPIINVPENEIKQVMPTIARTLSKERVEGVLRDLNEKQLLSLSVPAECCENSKHINDYHDVSDLPFSASLRSLPLDEDDLNDITRTLGKLISKDNIILVQDENDATNKNDWEIHYELGKDEGSSKWYKAFSGTDVDANISIEIQTDHPIVRKKVLRNSKNITQKDDPQNLATINEEENLVEKIPSVHSNTKNILLNQNKYPNKTKTTELRYFTVDYPNLTNISTDQIFSCTKSKFHSQSFLCNNYLSLDRYFKLDSNSSSTDHKHLKNEDIASSLETFSLKNKIYSIKKKIPDDTSHCFVTHPKLNPVHEMIMLNAIYLSDININHNENLSVPDIYISEKSNQSNYCCGGTQSKVNQEVLKIHKKNHLSSINNGKITNKSYPETEEDTTLISNNNGHVETGGYTSLSPSPNNNEILSEVPNTCSGQLKENELASKGSESHKAGCDIFEKELKENLSKNKLDSAEKIKHELISFKNIKTLDLRSNSNWKNSKIKFKSYFKDLKMRKENISPKYRL